MTEIRVIDLSEAQVFENESLISRRLVRREHGSQGVSMNVTTLHAGYNDQSVGYPEHDEICYLLSGTADFTVNGKTQRIGKGKAFFVPRGTTYGYKVVEGPNEMVVVFSPAKN